MRATRRYGEQNEPQQETNISLQYSSCLVVLKICAVPRTVSVISLADMLTQWVSVSFVTWYHQLICSCSNKLAKRSSVSLQLRKTEESRKTSVTAPRSSLKLISSSESEDEQSPRTSACTAPPLLQAAFKRK